MQNLSKPELLSVLDFIFAIKKINDSDTLYKTMEKLARDALRCDELLIGTCSDTTSGAGCGLGPTADDSGYGAHFEAHDGAHGVRQMPCRSSCSGSKSAVKEAGAREASSTDITTTDDGVMVCNYSSKSPLLCAAFVSQDKEHHPDMALLESLTPYLSDAIERISSNSVADKFCGKARDVFLTTREKEILQWVSLGKSCGETGSILGITERTIKFHLQNVYRKLEVVNRAQAVTVAHQYALI